jgi:spoIIIJ-associated protein
MTETTSTESSPDVLVDANPVAVAESSAPESSAPESTPADRTKALLAKLEREGDIAADFLEELLDIADLDGDIDLDVEGDRAMVAIVGDDLESLAGRDGKVLDALQELTRLAVYQETGERSRLVLDVAEYRAKRRTELSALAVKAVDEVKATGKPVAMAPMTAFERKIVHDAVAAAGLTSESDGADPNRHVVVSA